MAWKHTRPTTGTNRQPGDGETSISDPQDIFLRERWQGACATTAPEAFAPAQLVVGAVLGDPGGIVLFVAGCQRCGGAHYYATSGFKDLRPGERIWALCDAPGPAGPPGACGRCARIVPADRPAVYYDAGARASREGRTAMRRIRRLGLPTSRQTLGDLRVMALMRSRPKARRKLRSHVDIAIEYGGDLVYSDFDAAATALFRFIETNKLPIPAILVDTGAGAGARARITCVWPLDEPLPSDAWMKVARKIKRRCGQRFWPDVIGDLSHTGQLLIEGDGADPRAALAVRPRRGW